MDHAVCVSLHAYRIACCHILVIAIVVACLLHCMFASLLVCILSHAWLGCITFGMLVTLALCMLRLHSITFPCCIVFGILACITLCLVWGVKPNTRSEECSYLKWRDVPQSLVADALDPTWQSVWPSCVLCIYSILICTLGSFGHHALKCVIDGPRIENRTPLSLWHDREGACAHIALKMHCHALFVLCCSKIAFCRKRWPVGHLQCRSATNLCPRAPLLVDD